MNILIHFASGKTKRLNGIKDSEGKVYDDFDKLIDNIYGLCTDISIFDTYSDMCAINLNHVEMIEEVKTI